MAKGQRQKRRSYLRFGYPVVSDAWAGFLEYPVIRFAIARARPADYFNAPSTVRP